MADPGATFSVVQTGIAGLDEVLEGGFLAGAAYLIEGAAGAGKTTLALQFALEGLRRGESVLYVTLAESKEEIDVMARSHGWDISALHWVEAAPPQEILKGEAKYTMFHPAEVELTDTLKQIAEQVDRLKPARMVIDSLVELRLIAQSPLRYRRQLLALKHFLSQRRCTALWVDTQQAEEGPTRTAVHGIVTLEQFGPEYGGERRRLRVVKSRWKAVPQRLPRLSHSPGRAGGVPAARGYPVPRRTPSHLVEQRPARH